LKILYVTTSEPKNIIDSSGIYIDLLKLFVKNGHDLFIIGSHNNNHSKTLYIEEGDIKIVKARLNNVKQMNILYKFVVSIFISGIFKKVYKEYFSNIDFDLILYATPPVTYCSLIKYVKERTGCKSYLMLKDIYPQSIVDLKYLSKWNPVYLYMKYQETRIYQVSDRIGCMSNANIQYLIDRYKHIDHDKIGLFPNALDASFKSKEIPISILRQKYNLPDDKTVFVYGGTLGRAQGIPFLLDCLDRVKSNSRAFFVIVGAGTFFNKIDAFVKMNSMNNVRVIRRMEKDDFHQLVTACDVGLIFLDHRFTIPNFPSRLLSYMKSGLPVLACTDEVSDIKDVIRKGDYGWWIKSDEPDEFSKIIDVILESDYVGKGQIAYNSFVRDFNIKENYNTIMAAMINC
jgi:glycosyltransferase involved in cell wall biosynthesis